MDHHYNCFVQVVECIAKGIFKKVNEKVEVGEDWEPKHKGNHGKGLAMNRLDANGKIHGDMEKCSECRKKKYK